MNGQRKFSGQGRGAGALAGPAEPSPAERGTARLKVPPGFSVSVFADEVESARSLCLSPSGVLYVGTKDEGVVYALRDTDGDGRAEERYVVARGMCRPTGVAFRDGALYVADVSRVLKYEGIEKDLAAPPEPETVSDAFPSKRRHGWKFIRFGPDGMLYVPVGAPCDVCEREEEIYASITRLKPDGTGLEIFARGVRNTGGFDWHPDTGDLWFTDNGRDDLGDDLPPDELNRAPRPGLHFGFPYFNGREQDPDYGRGKDPAGFVPPELELGPHVVALGMRFYTGRMFPERYRGSIFIAERGSRTRAEPIGYRLMNVRLENGRAASYEVFAEGWLDGRHAWGRPVDLEIMPDGSLLVSDDKTGAVYRITYSGKR